MSTPHYITIPEGIAIHAARRAVSIGGGVRLWAMGKALDTQGLGRIRRDDLKAFYLSTGENVRNYYRWVNNARANGLLFDVQAKNGEWFFILPTPAKVAIELDLQTVGTRKLIIPLEILVTNGWRAHVESALEDTRRMSREQIHKEYHIPLRTQTYRAQQAELLRTRNYAKTNKKADQITGIKEHNPRYKAPFVMRAGFIARRLPDLRSATKAHRGRKGRNRKSNTEIRRSRATQSALSYMRQGLSDESPRLYIRLFHQTGESRRTTERMLDRQNLRRPDLFQHLRECRTGAVIWRQF